MLIIPFGLQVYIFASVHQKWFYWEWYSAKYQEQSHVIYNLILGCIVFSVKRLEKNFTLFVLTVTLVDLKFLRWKKDDWSIFITLHLIISIFIATLLRNFSICFSFSLMGTWQVYLICLSFLVSDIPCGGHNCI